MWCSVKTPTTSLYQLFPVWVSYHYCDSETEKPLAMDISSLADENIFDKRFSFLF